MEKYTVSIIGLEIVSVRDTFLDALADIIDVKTTFPHWKLSLVRTLDW